MQPPQKSSSPAITPLFFLRKGKPAGRSSVQPCSSRGSPFDFSMQLMRKKVVDAIGPQSLEIAHVISNVADELHIPLLSFGATDPSLYALLLSSNDYK